MRAMPLTTPPYLFVACHAKQKLRAISRLSTPTFLHSTISLPDQQDRQLILSGLS